MRLEDNFDVVFAAGQGLREKQIQQSYRPIIGIHKWFARRPGTVFRSLMLAEFDPSPLAEGFWRAHQFPGVIADPFMGGGTPIFEANRLGFNVVGADINPMAYWVVRQGLSALDLAAFAATAAAVAADAGQQIGDLYQTRCLQCGDKAVAKYFLWVKTEICPYCTAINDLFPGYLLAEAVRHPRHVVVCAACGELNEYESVPRHGSPGACRACRATVVVEGPASRQHICCRRCERRFAYPVRLDPPGPPRHRMWALEYHCGRCKPGHQGRFFKRPDEDDLAVYARASQRLAASEGLPIPADAIPHGDETARLHRWGYGYYREMFNPRQQLGLGLLLQRIRNVEEREVRYALLTVFSDCLRYQNMLCRYDTYALKCQDIFSVHGFPVGLLPCENNLLGIPTIGSGSFRHFVEKYLRAKRYGQAPFETRREGTRKQIVPIVGEQIGAELVRGFPVPHGRQAWLAAAPADSLKLPEQSLDGVFTDPPYFDNVQYAELMDFCFAWLRLGLKHEVPEFDLASTRNLLELTGNVTAGRGLESFTSGLSAIFSHYAAALKPSAPFVFTFHHNDPGVYMPLVVSILDAGLGCRAVLPVVAEMTASLHIAGTGSSTLDSVFVCRKGRRQSVNPKPIAVALESDVAAMDRAGVRVTEGDVRCLAAGHLAMHAVRRLAPEWLSTAPLPRRMLMASQCLRDLTAALDFEAMVGNVLAAIDSGARRKGKQSAASL